VSTLQGARGHAKAWTPSAAVERNCAVIAHRILKNILKINENFSEQKAGSGYLSYVDVAVRLGLAERLC
jgi:hypothetical protein